MALQMATQASALTLIAYGLLLSFVGALTWGLYCRTWHPLSKVPGPFWPSVTRIWIIYHVQAGDTDVVQRKLHKQYGPLVRIAPNEISVADPEAIRKIYRTKDPLTKTFFYPIWRNMTFSKNPDTFTVVDEKLHSDRRRIVNNVYSMSTILTLEPYIDKCASLFLQRLSVMAEAGSEVDLGVWLQWYAFDVIGELFFGSMFGFMERSTDHKDWIASLDTVVPLLATAGAASPIYRTLIMGSAIVSSTTRAALKNFDSLVAVAKQCVAERLSVESLDKRDTRTDLMRHLLDIRKNKADEAEFGVGDIQSESFVAFFAGSDTTAIALRAVFYYLCKNRKAYEELQTVVDMAFAQGTVSNPPRYAETQQIPLLRATIKEAMRLHPSVGLTMPRYVDTPGIEIAGMYIPAGTAVGMNAAVVGRDKKLYGDDAEEFRPRRWLEGDNETNMDRYSLVFGAGTRTCIGKNISLSEIYKIVPLMIHIFDIALTEPKKEWVTEDFWFNKQTGLNVKLHVRA